mgnify:FL=1|jgi:hypothetical protein|tara:strand:+ start:328 stop:597 length:270 start_codon:yes stop_codon:yes gene_type:complete
MELLIYGTAWLTLCCLVAGVLYELHYPKKVVKGGLNVAYEICLHKAEEQQVLLHKWLESEKAGYDIGMEKAQESWAKYHKDNWRKSKSA